MKIECTDGVFALGLVSPVLQLVVAGVEGERLHDVTSGAQKLPVQLAHCK